MNARPPRPNGPIWRPSGPRRTAARAWPGWPARSRPCGPASNRSTTAWPGCPSASRRPPTRAQQTQAEFETVQGRVGELDSGRGRPRRAPRPDGRRAAAGRRARRRTAGRPSAAPNAKWLRCGPASTRCRWGSSARTARRGLRENRSGAGLFGSVAKLVKVRPGTRRRWPRCSASAADALAADSFGAAAFRGRRAEAGRRRPCGHRAGRLAAQTTTDTGGRCPTARAGRSTWSRRRSGCAARWSPCSSGVAVVDDLAAALDLVAAPPAAARGHRSTVTWSARGWVSGGSDRKPSHAGDHLGNRQGAATSWPPPRRRWPARRGVVRRADRAARPSGFRRAGAGRAQRVRRRDLGDLRAARPARPGRPRPPRKSGTGCCASARSWRRGAPQTARRAHANSKPGCATPRRPTSRPRRTQSVEAVSGSPPRPRPPAASRWRPGWRCAPPRSAPMPCAGGRIRCAGRPPRNARRGCGPSRRTPRGARGRGGRGGGRRRAAAGDAADRGGRRGVAHPRRAGRRTPSSGRRRWRRCATRCTR